MEVSEFQRHFGHCGKTGDDQGNPRISASRPISIENMDKATQAQCFMFHSRHFPDIVIIHENQSTPVLGALLGE